MSGDGTQISAVTRSILKTLRHGKKYVNLTDIFPINLFPSRDGPLQPYLHKARWISQSIHPFINIQRIFYSGISGMLEDEDDEE